MVFIKKGAPTAADASGFIFVDSESNTTVTTIKKGTTVVWVNMTTVPHTVTADATSAMQFDSGVVTPATKNPYYMMTFNQVGKFTYSCIVHPGQVGEIDVTA